MARDFSTRPVIRIAAALLCDREGRMLLVRKRGTFAFMQPGGKIEADEDEVTALVRELREELGIVVPPAQPVHLGCFAAPAANEPGHVVEAALFRVELVGTARAAAEIEEMIWVDPEGALLLDLAALTRDHVLPIYAAMYRSETQCPG
jgi:8-oxo-dGTP pyrophosphatase MutT (NUDIX family)